MVSIFSYNISNSINKVKFSLEHQLIILVLFFSFLTHGQNRSLSKIDQAKSDTQKIRLLLDASNTVLSQSPEESASYAERALILAKKISCVECEIKALMQIASIERINENQSLSIELLEKALLKASKLQGKSRYKNEATIHGELGLVYRTFGKYSTSIDQLEKGISISIKYGLTAQKAKLYNSIGGVYFETDEKEKGLDYCLRSLKIYKTELPGNVSDICLLSANIGNLLISNQKYTEAEKILREAEELSLGIGNPYISSLIKSGLGICYINKAEFETALKYLKEALVYSKKSGNLTTEIALTGNIGSVYISLKKFKEAEDLLVPTYQKAKRSGQKFLAKEVLAVVINLYKEMNQFETAFNYQNELIELKNEIFSEDLKLKLSRLDVKIKNAEKEKKISELTILNQRKNFELNQNRFYIVTGAIIILLLFSITVFMFQRTKYKNRVRMNELENKMFLLQMRPHFIFNVLSSIQSYMSQNKGMQASVYLSKFARLIRNVLEQSQQEFTTISHEVEILRYYLELQQMRFNNCFQYAINVDENIDDEITYIPPMLIQPLVENAIEHGLQQVESGKVEIYFEMKVDSLFVTITDNGIGMKKGITKQDGYSIFKGKSMSTKIIKDQLKQYSKEFKKEFVLSFSENTNSTQANNGTKVTIKLPIIDRN
jgi:tetratricopeptide (TPR) repeat protein